MAGTTGLEPAASAVTGQRSNQLNYVPTRQCSARKSALHNYPNSFWMGRESAWARSDLSSASCMMSQEFPRRRETRTDEGRQLPSPRAECRRLLTNRYLYGEHLTLGINYLEAGARNLTFRIRSRRSEPWS